MPLRARKDEFQRTEVGILPSDWEVTQIGNLSKTASGTTPSRACYDLYFNGGTYPWVKTLDLNNSLLTETDECITEAALAETSLHIFPAGTVLVAMYGGFNQIGRTGILTIPACVNQAITAILPKKNLLDSTYLLYVLNNHVSYWSSVASSSRKDPNITGNDVRNFVIALPKLFEQQAIAEALSDADGLIEGLETLIAKKRAIKQGVMQELLSGRQRLAGFSKSWKPTKLRELGSFLKGSGVKKDQAQSGNLPCVRYGEIYTDHNDVLLMFRSFISRGVADTATRIKVGDILFAGSGETKEEIGKCVAVVTTTEAYAGGDIVILRTSDHDPVFLGYALNFPEVQRQKASRGQGDAVVHISASALGAIDIMLPELKEQAAIAAVISEMDGELTVLEAKLVKARQIKQGMMQDLLTGRVRLV